MKLADPVLLQSTVSHRTPGGTSGEIFNVCRVFGVPPDVEPFACSRYLVAEDGSATFYWDDSALRISELP